MSIIRFDRNPRFDPSKPKEALEWFAGRSVEVTAGFWHAEPYVKEIQRYGVDEFMLVLEGEIVVTDRDGRSESFGPGDAFMLTADFRGTWEVRKAAKKFYVVSERGE